MKAGALLIWNCLQQHGVHPNKSETVKLAQYISMLPAEEKMKLFVSGVRNPRQYVLLRMVALFRVIQETESRHVIPKL